MKRILIVGAFILGFAFDQLSHAQSVQTNPSATGIGGGGGSGSVTSVSVTTANGVSGTVATATTTPAISLALGDITPTSTSPATGTITAAKPVINASSTWNNSGVTFTADKLNVIDTASASASLLVDWQLNSASVLSLRKDGLWLPASGIFQVNGQVLGAGLKSSSYLVANTLLYFGAGTDTAMARNAAGVVEVNNGTAGTFADLKARNITLSGTTTIPDNGTISGATAPSGSITVGNGGSNPYITIAANSYNFKLQGGVITSDPVIIPRLQTLTNMPTCNSGTKGARATVSDATQTFTSANFGTAVTGGGSNMVPVTCDGTSWKIGIREAINDEDKQVLV